jgi:hypothetical protein
MVRRAHIGGAAHGAALVALSLLGTLLPGRLAAQPRPVDDVSVRAALAVEELERRVARDDWTQRHGGPWLYTNDQWTNAAQVTYFPAGTAYWIAVVVDECAGCEFDVRFFDEDAGGYFSLAPILSIDSDGSLVTATGRFEAERDMRGELYALMVGPDLYKTYLILAEVR